MLRHSGKIAIVTASTQGIGFAIAKKLAQEGAKVIISSRKVANVDEAVKKLNNEGLDVKGIVCHVANAEGRKALFSEASKLGGLDILVSNAAVNPSFGPIFTCSEAEWEKIFNVNVKSSFLLAKEALPLLKKSKAGRLMFISSVVGLQAPFKEIGAYSVSKTALLGMTKMASMELGSSNITVNTICPGIIETKFSEVITRDIISDKELLARISLNRFGKPEDISGCVSFLASEEASYITGENIAIAGGLNSRI